MTTSTTDIIPGAAVRDGHRFTVLSVVGPELALPVLSGGDRFYMAGKFPFRHVLPKLGRAPEAVELGAWVGEIRSQRVDPYIMVAEAPEKVPRRVYLALIGGAAHEALHRLLTRQGDVTAVELRAALAPAYADPQRDWSAVGGLLPDLQNVLEDIWIERIGRVMFPGLETKLHDLADFILDQEDEGRRKAGNPTPTPTEVAFSLLREYGLGYNTDKVQARLTAYRAAQPAVAALFEGGPLEALLDRSIPDVSSVEAARARLLEGVTTTLALEWAAALSSLAEKKPSPAPAPQGKKAGGSASGSGGGAGTEEEGRRAAAAVLAGHKTGGSGLLDNNAALGAAFAALAGQEAGRAGARARPYRPFSTSEDQIGPVSPDGVPLGAAELAEVRAVTAFLRTRLGLLFRGIVPEAREHGVRRGTGLSGRMLVDTVAQLRGGAVPDRAFYQDDDHTVDTSVAAALVLDESHSMEEPCSRKPGERRTKARAAAQATAALGLALDAIGAKSAAIGFRRRPGDSNPHRGPFTAPALEAAAQEEEKKQKRGPVRYHRCYPMRYDVFKGWEERWAAAAPRLGHWKATGSTPMADGIEVALRQLNARREAHRVMFIFTDGQPDADHLPVIRSQLERARAAGIHVIGVGIGEEARYVCDLFDDHVQTDDVSSLPRPLISKLEQMVRAMRGRAARPLST